MSAFDRIDQSIIHQDVRSSYFTWVAILVLIVVSQLFGFFEKVRLLFTVHLRSLTNRGFLCSSGSKSGARYVLFLNTIGGLTYSTTRHIIPSFQAYPTSSTQRTNSLLSRKRRLLHRICTHSSSTQNSLTSTPLLFPLCTEGHFSMSSSTLRSASVAW